MTKHTYFNTKAGEFQQHNDFSPGASCNRDLFLVYILLADNL